MQTDTEGRAVAIGGWIGSRSPHTLREGSLRRQREGLSPYHRHSVDRLGTDDVPPPARCPCDRYHHKLNKRLPRVVVLPGGCEKDKNKAIAVNHCMVGLGGFGRSTVQSSRFIDWEIGTVRRDFSLFSQYSCLEP